jgi:hypothetical protein
VKPKPFISADRDEVAARGADIVDHGVKRDLRVFLAQPAHLVVDGLRLDRAAARGIAAHHDTLGVLVLECLLQRGGHAVGAGIGAGRDHAAHLDHRGVLLAARTHLAAALPIHRDHQNEGEVGESEQLEEDAPAARAALLVERRGRELRDQVTLPLRVVVSHLGIP